MDFTEWKKLEHHKGKFFITDGIIDKEKWNKSRIKILYILKEAYEKSPEDTEEWDLCEYLRKGLSVVRKKMWWTLSHWSYGIHKLIETGEVEKFDEEYKHNSAFNEVFLSAAIINIKKSSGKSNSNNQDLQQYVEKDWELLEKQINEINPDIIICGSTWPIIQKYLNNPQKQNEWLYKADNRYFVDFWHPANQYPNKLNYYSLITALKISISTWNRAKPS